MTEKDSLGEHHPEFSFTHMAEKVEEVLGANLASYIALGDPDIPADQQKIKGDGYRLLIETDEETQTRIKNTFDVLKLFESASEDPNLVRAWFIGMKEEWNDLTPATLIIVEPGIVHQSASSFIERGFESDFAL